MSDRVWTKDQEKVIKSRGRNLLVSAAAGSGKTAVLTERIISLLTEEGSDTDIDEILVVTFTRAAAAEMKERIALAIEDRLAENKEDMRLVRQSALLPAALISTIDSFCGYVVKNYFNTIGLSPGFRVGDNEELTIMGEELLTKVLAEYYEKNDPDFELLISSFGQAKGDKKVREMIMDLIRFAEGYPDERAYIEGIAKQYHPAGIAECEWGRYYLNSTAFTLADALGLLKGAIEDADVLGVPAAVDFLNSEAGQLERISKCSDYTSMKEALDSVEFKRYPAGIKKSYEGDPADVESIKKRRDTAKKIVTELKKKFASPEERVLEILSDASVFARILSDITLDFYDRLLEEKKRKGCFSFSDIAHFALNILTDVKTGEPKAPAYDFAGRFKHIMTDEYQDTNYVQEMIFESVIRASGGKTLLFMVGDVKQSIYSFRQARPEIFMEKAARFSAEEKTVSDEEAESDTQDKNELISLSANFRSDQNVIRDINLIFEKIMKADFGGIEYDVSHRLFFRDPERAEEYSEENRTELLLVMTDADEEDDEAGGSDSSVANVRIDPAVAESRTIAGRIRRLVEEGYKYSDIAVIASSVRYISEALLKELSCEGIPAKLSGSASYLLTVEVKNLLTFLRVLCNPRVDIDLAGLMLSPICEFTPDELVIIRGKGEPEGLLYDDVKAFIGKADGEEERYLAGKLTSFLAELDRYRALSEEVGLRTLLMRFISETGYVRRLLMQPSGKLKAGNTELLLREAENFEKNGSKTVFEFVKYTEKLLEYGNDRESAENDSSDPDAVHVMTIHKSKGLEFSVVILAGLGRQFIKRDKGVVNCDIDYGAALPAIYREKHIKRRTLFETVLAEKKRDSLVAERLRVLYVALTRAKRKLIMTGVATEKKLEGLSEREDCFGYNARRNANSFLELVYPAACGNSAFLIGRYDARELCADRDKEAVLEQIDRVEGILSLQGCADEDTALMLKKRIAYCYPFEDEVRLSPKVSVSELKGREPDPEAFAIFPEETALYVPAFAVEEASDKKGTVYGSTVHRLMELLRFDDTPVNLQIEELVRRGFMTEEEGSSIRVLSVERFLRSPLGQRVKSAFSSGKLFREQAFTMQIKASEAFASCDSDMPVLVQGVTDAWFFEGEDTILLDYKTDFVENKEELVRRYHRQLELYAAAVEGATGKSVKEKYIYSFCLGEAILV